MRWTLLTLALATLLPAVAAANPAIQIVHRTEQDQPSYVRLTGVPLPGLGVASKQDQQQISGRMLQRYAAPIFNLDNQAEQALGDAAIQTLRDGAVRYSWQQRFAGVPVFNGKLTALVDTKQSVRVLSGQLAMQAPSALHQNNPATAARLLPLAAASIEANVPGNWAWQQQSPEELRWQRTANGAAALTAIRALPVYVLQQNSAVPAWSFELEKTTGRRSSLWRLVLDETGNIVRKQSLSRDAAFSYKVYASSSGDQRPLDSPYGDLTPLPAGDLTPVYVTANTVSVDELASTHSNSWLPNGASTLIGNHAEVYLDISGSDGFDASDRRAPQSAAGQFHWTFNGANDVRSSSDNQNAAMVQAFYVANWLHDFFFDAGFVTADGTAEAGDRMLIEVQDAEDTNNANMSVPGNGLSPRMQVFLFDGPSSHSAQVSGALTASYTTSRADFGPSNFNVTSQLVLMQDGAGLNVTDGCETLTNASQLAGKIALVDRGNCNFVDKANRAQQAGAIGLLVANNTSGTLTMGSPDGSPVISIGALLINQVDGNAVKAAVQSGTVNANLVRSTATPIDGALDSALVAHEWGHYINNRLMDIGSVNQANGMDEGWSDFIALFALSASSDDDGGSRILGSFGFSGYAVNDFGNGLRRFPYSADSTINSLSFRHISNGIMLPNGQAGTSNSEVHNTGEIWASSLWDAYVNLVRSRGYSEAQLRMREYLVQGMKNTASQPDFVEARDAQLDAVAALQPVESPDDLALFQQAFAGRGLGINADAPSKADDTQAGAIESFIWTATAVPAVNAGPDQTVVQAAEVALNGTATDADGSIATYQWQQLSGPEVTLNNSDSASASFTAPSACPSTPLVFELTATDNLQERASDQLTVTVTPAANANPTANAGTDQTVAEGAAVNLTGGGADTDGTIVSYRWSQISGRAGSFANAAAANTSFTAPMVSGTSNVILQLTVTDNMCATATDTVTVSVQNTAGSGGGGGGGGGTTPLILAGLLSLLACWRRKT